MTFEVGKRYAPKWVRAAESSRATTITIVWINGQPRPRASDGAVQVVWYPSVDGGPQSDIASFGWLTPDDFVEVPDDETYLIEVCSSHGVMQIHASSVQPFGGRPPEGENGMRRFVFNVNKMTVTPFRPALNGL